MRAALVIIVLAAGGCATVPDSGVRASGAPLVVDVQEESWTALASRPVGQVTFTDAAGRQTGSATVSETHQVRMRQLHWRGMQDGRVISDEDLFRIAGDAEAAEIDRRYRRNGRIMQWAGAALALAGLVELVVARQRGWTESRGAQIAAGAAYGGLVGGIMFVVWGRKRLHPDRHPVGLARAQAAALRYNAGR